MKRRCFIEDRLWGADVDGDCVAGKRELPDGFRVELQAPFSFLDDVQLHTAFQEIKDDRRTRDVDSMQEDRERT